MYLVQMNRIYPWIVGGLAGVIVIMILFDKPEPYDTSQWKEAIQRSNDKITVLQQDKQKLARKIAEDSILRHEQSQAYQQDVKIKSAAIAKLKANPRVVYIRESEPVVDSLIVAYDSIVQLKNDRIDELEVSLYELQINMKAVNVNCDQMLEAERDKFKASEELISDLEKQNRKERRKRKLATILIPIVGVGALFLGGL